MVNLPSDSPDTFPGIPLIGHLCSITRGNRKLYWLVEGLIEASKNLPVRELEIDSLVDQLGNSTWFSKDAKPTITEVLRHIERALAADLDYPLILSCDGKIMDGTHRLIAAKIKGRTTLPCVQFEKDPAWDYEEELAPLSGPLQK